MGISEVMYSYGLSVFSIVLIFLLAYLQLKINKSELRQWCIMIVACSLITNVSIMFQIVNIVKENSNIIYEAFSFIGLNMMPVCCFFAVCYFTNSNFKFSKKYIGLFIIPILCIIATFTNDYHNLVFQAFSTNFVKREYGIIFYIMLINISITYLLTIRLILLYLAKDIEKYKYQLALSFAFIVIPAILLLLGSFRIIDIKSYSSGILQSSIAIIIIEILLKYQLLTLIPISLINVLDTITDGFFIINKKGIIVAYNRVFLDLFELENLDIQRLNIRELLDFKEFDTLNDEDIDKIISMNNKDSKIVFERVSNKLELTLKYECSPLYENSNKFFIISIVDITSYSKDIQKIKLNEDALLSKERLASLGQMIGGIAHNLKTPIFSIAGAIEGIEDLVHEYKESISDETVTIDDHKDIAKDMYEWTEKIQSYLSYMTDIITAIQMQMSADYGDDTDSFTIKELIKYLNVLMKYELNHNLIELEINVKTDEELKINGNINNLIQVLNNIISNSIQAYSNQDKKKKIILDIYEDNGNIYFEVTDYAGGISEDVKNKLFKEMVTTKGKNGTGLGLFISYTSIKTSFGGNLCFSTKQGVGTTFKIIIPKNIKSGGNYGS